MRPVSQLLVLLALVLGTAARSYHRHEQHTQILKDPGERHETGGTNKYIIEVEKVSDPEEDWGTVPSQTRTERC